MTQYTEHCSTTLATSEAGLTDGIAQLARQWIAFMRLKLQIRRERRQLAHLSNAMLKDIGIESGAAQAEAQQTDIPATRLRSLQG